MWARQVLGGTLTADVQIGQILAGGRIAAGISAPWIGSVVELDPLIAAATVPSVEAGPALGDAHAARDELAAWRSELLAGAAESLAAIASAETDAFAELAATHGQLTNELRAAREDADSQLAEWLAEAAVQLNAARAAAAAWALSENHRSPTREVGIWLLSHTLARASG